MRRIAIEEPPPLSLTVAMTLLRSITAIVVFAYGWQSWQHLAGWQTELMRFGVIAADDVVARWSLAAVFLLGLGLALGWATRLWSFGLLCAEVLVLVAAYTSGSLRLGGFEYPLLVAAVSLLLLITGGGRISIDRFLFERARRKAIESDERWSLSPYVPAEAEQDYEASPSTAQPSSADGGW
jgi:uncharacterized membrane protein YphA (DoxX/SURF4 family)